MAASHAAIMDAIYALLQEKSVRDLRCDQPMSSKLQNFRFQSSLSFNCPLTVP